MNRPFSASDQASDATRRTPPPHDRLAESMESIPPDHLSCGDPEYPTPDPKKAFTHLLCQGKLSVRLYFWLSVSRAREST